jgi:RNA methyltransferase, TrmH family
MSFARVVRSRENPFYKWLRKLAGSARERRSQGKTLLDGEHLVEVYVDRIGPPDCLVLRESGQAAFAAVPGQERVLLSDPLFDALAPTRTPAGLMALITIPSVPQVGEELTVLLEDIQDPGNLGTLLRTAAAAGVEAVYLSRGCAEAWSPKALRAGQGAHFCLPVQEGSDLVSLAAALPGQVLATSPDATDAIYSLDLTGPTAFLFGNEGAGLSRPLMDSATRRVRIPMPGGMESLNVSAAAAICLFERVRQQGSG